MAEDTIIDGRQAYEEGLHVSQAQVARIEKAGYDCYTLNTLRRYVEALGSDFTLQVAIARTG